MERESSPVFHPTFSPVRASASDIVSLSSSDKHSDFSEETNVNTDSPSSSPCHSELSQLSQDETHLSTSPVQAVEEDQLQTETHSPSSRLTTHGFKFVIDNIDSTVKPHYMREDSQHQSLHYVQVYAVKHCIDFSSFLDSPPSSVKNINSILPTSGEYQTLKENMAVLVARMLIDHVPFFSEDYKGLVNRYISHHYSTQMALKSEVVRLYL